ncbi:hypothetical protein ASF61_13150 [Duganella sp. Leaf126]|uniref:transcriptional regulator n=1 Tax=Duganella sp. Leaf126 TaxID=1736266 RepID=UPI0007132706|nr:transcriptional regulator [Duganella sp. Leaf126]KQQ33025.1 hypothetical protein ASF61_13150 [Duganella sp. Leaf126]
MKNKTSGYAAPDPNAVCDAAAVKTADQFTLRRITARDQHLICDLRHVMRENQTQFWRRFGVTQTQGSRFERGRPVPLAVLMLIRLYLLHSIDDRDLQQVGCAQFDAGGVSPGA